MTGRTDSVSAMRNFRTALEIQNNVTRGDTEFCNHENIEDAISTLSEELESLGISAPKDDTEYSNSIQSLQSIFINLANASWSLVHRHRGLMRSYEELKDAHHKITNDNANLANHVKRLKENVEKKDHALCEAAERERRLKVDSGKLSRDLKREKEETIKLRKQLQSKDVQHAHELRRIQQSGQKLRDQLQKSSGSCGPKDRASQKLQAESEKKLRLYEKTIQRLEDNNGLMLEEINELREALALHVRGIELQVEASGVWADTET